MNYEANSLETTNVQNITKKKKKNTGIVGNKMGDAEAEGEHFKAETLR